MQKVQATYTNTYRGLFIPLLILSVGYMPEEVGLQPFLECPFGDVVFRGDFQTFRSGECNRKFIVDFSPAVSQFDFGAKRHRGV